MTVTVDDDGILDLLPSDIERGRYRSLVVSLQAYAHLFRDQRVLDFGASWGTSAVALLRAGARHVIGIEPSSERVAQGHDLIRALDLEEHISLFHISDTRRLPWADDQFPFVLANGVVEHIPRPARLEILREVWRLIAPAGHFMITETPNSYFPRDQHTTQLWFNHWLPERWAHRRAVRAGAFRAERTDWASSGWRGAGYYELVRPLRGASLVPETLTRTRQRLLSWIGLPPMLIDPWPIWVFRKRVGP
jgi:ubiquinone/menaquinone biosynthesis C-methylase UbiE